MREKSESKYGLAECPCGFRIESSNRVPVTVTLQDTGFRVEVHRQQQLKLFAEVAEDATPRRRKWQRPDTNLVQYPKLVELIADGLMSEWKPLPGRKPLWRIRKWAIAQTRRALGRRIHEQWQRLIAKADPTIWGVQKAIFSASFRESELQHELDLYLDRYLVQDIQRYLAAAAVVPGVEDLLLRTVEEPREEDVQPVDDEEDPTFSVEERVAALSDWQGLLSPTGSRYRSLSRTLMQLPGGIPSSLLNWLQRLRLIRRVADRLELTTLLLSKAESMNGWETDEPPHRLFYHASRD